VSSHTTVDDIVINGAITKRLPPTIPQGVPVELAYTFTNRSNGDATGVAVQLPGVSVSSNCPFSQGTIKAHSSCQVLMRYTPPMSMVGKTKQFPVKLTYNEGAPVVLMAETKVVQ